MGEGRREGRMEGVSEEWREEIEWREGERSKGRKRYGWWREESMVEREKDGEETQWLSATLHQLASFIPRCTIIPTWYSNRKLPSITILTLPPY